MARSSSSPNIGSWCFIACSLRAISNASAFGKSLVSGGWMMGDDNYNFGQIRRWKTRDFKRRRVNLFVPDRMLKMLASPDVYVPCQSMM
jgi:hypothetical protein